MQRLSDSHQGADAETSSLDAVSPISPDSPSRVRRPRIQSRDSEATSSDSDEIQTEVSGCDRVREHCFYEEHLKSRKLHVDTELDYFLLEHLMAGHLSPCSPLPTSGADEFFLDAPIRQEIPFDRVHCLQPVNLRHELLSPRHIRLLKLYPSTQTNLPGDTPGVVQSVPLRCDAYQACLDDLTTNGPPLFAAASYVCGDQTLTQSIICGQSIIQIPQNAYHVLYHLRFQTRPRTIWIDFLCIKQEDAREKSHQVAMLHTIYAQAHVVSWLGTCHEIDLEGVSFYLTLFARLWVDEVRMTHPWSKPGMIMYIYQRVRRSLERLLENQVEVLHHGYSLQALDSIFAMDYFTRVWIVQEIILGKTNVCQLGNHLFSLAVLTAASRVLAELESDNPTTTNPECAKIDFETIERIQDSHLRPALQNRWCRPLHNSLRSHDLTVVTKLNHGTCSDPRDYIYGVTSLFLESDQYGIDYTLSKSEVFSDFTAHCVSGGQGIDVLNQDRLTMESISAYRDPGPGLPSWCPDWSVAGRGNDVLFEGNGFDWQASGTHEFAYSRPSRVTLTLKGVAVTKIHLRNESLLKWVHGIRGLHWIWFEHSEHFRAFLKLQGLKIDHGAKDAILRIFGRILPPESVASWSDLEISPELRLLFDQVCHDDLTALLAPVYLAAVDSELLKATGLNIDARVPLEDYPAIEDEFRDMLSLYGLGTRLFATENGMQGAGYPGIRSGDLVCIIYGSNVPQVLRQVDADDDDHYILVGACNVDGLMFGEGLDMGLTEQEFILV
jgi:hypothetical protein